MKQAVLAIVLVLGACREQRPPGPTAEEADQLNEAEKMLDNASNQKGPEERSPGPS